MKTKRLKPGPKPRPPSEVRAGFHVRLTPGERAAFEKAAGALGLGVSAWLRMLGLREVKDAVPRG